MATSIREGFIGTVGNTPLIRLRRVSEETGCEILGKAEFLNPGGSVKDRAALRMIETALSDGRFGPGRTLVDSTSGNTGVALAMVGAAKGYRVRILMSQGASHERRHLIRQLGAELVLFSSEGRYQTGIEMSRDMVARDPRCFVQEHPGMFEVFHDVAQDRQVKRLGLVRYAIAIEQLALRQPRDPSSLDRIEARRRYLEAIEPITKTQV